jgi:hypothetical protein
LKFNHLLICADDAAVCILDENINIMPKTQNLCNRLMGRFVLEANAEETKYILPPKGREKS